MLAFASANASLIGTYVHIGYVDNNADTLDTVFVTDGFEFTNGDGSNLANSVPGSLGVFEYIDIGADFIEIAFNLSINVGASPAYFTFSGLDGVIGASLFSSDIPTITAADLSLVGDILTIDVGNQDPANYSPAAIVRIALAIPEPASLALVGLGLLALGFSRRRA